MSNPKIKYSHLLREDGRTRCGKAIKLGGNAPMCKVCVKASTLELTPRTKILIRNCAECGATFLISPAQHERGEGVYCNKKCSDKARKNGSFYAR